MSFNHLLLVGGGHTNVLLMQKWLMKPKSMPDIPITIISRDSYLVYSSMYPSVISNSINLKDSLIDISSLANRTKISFIQSEVKNIDFLNKKIIVKDRPCIHYSKMILNCGMGTNIPTEFKDLLAKKIAFPIRPFDQSFQLIKNEDAFNSEKELPFVIVGSGLAAIEIAFALRKRWEKRSIILACDYKKISKKFLKALKESDIKLAVNINFPYRKILLCTGNYPHLWIKENILKLDTRGRIITNNDLRVKNFPDIYAVGDCSSIAFRKGPSSGILAVKSSKTLCKNIFKDFEGKILNKWYPQKQGLQIVNCFNTNKKMAYAVYGKLTLGPTPFFWYLKNRIDHRFLEKFKPSKMINSNNKLTFNDMDCRGCAAKISKTNLTNGLKQANLKKIADCPEDASEIFRSDKEIIIQSIDGFPSLVSDPWLNAKITTLHACSDLWACGAKVSSGQVLISIPKVENNIQNYIFSQSLEGIRSTFEDLGGQILGGHTFESRNDSIKPASLGVELALSVQGILRNGLKPWKKSGFEPGDIILMSRPLGVGIFFAAQMRNINVFESYEEIYKNLLTSQQTLIEDIHIIQEKIGKTIIHASTDITGYGFLGHLNEMVVASNLDRQKDNLKEIKIILDLCKIRAYAGILELINLGVKSSLFYENNKIYDQISTQDCKNKSIYFSPTQHLNKGEFQQRIELLSDPQTCGPLLISCEEKYEKYFDNNWYKVGKVYAKED